jgi:hypothetical protein
MHGEICSATRRFLTLAATTRAQLCHGFVCFEGGWLAADNYPLSIAQTPPCLSVLVSDATKYSMAMDYGLCPEASSLAPG